MISVNCAESDRIVWWIFIDDGRRGGQRGRIGSELYVMTASKPYNFKRDTRYRIRGHIDIQIWPLLVSPASHRGTCPHSSQVDSMWKAMTQLVARSLFPSGAIRPSVALLPHLMAGMATPCQHSSCKIRNHTRTFIGLSRPKLHVRQPDGQRRMAVQMNLCVLLLHLVLKSTLL